MTKTINLSGSKLGLYLDSFITSTQMIVAKKRRGKSYLAQVQAEELLEAKQQVVALDPTGAWWGLRSSSDGRSAGYPIAVFGGDHGDVQIDPTGGELLARAIVEEGFSAVVDLTAMRKGERIRFGADFLETLYRLNRAAMHLFVDEADVFAPQVTRDPQQARLLGATDELVRRGGIRGIGVTLITQRTQVVSKDVISQVDSMMVLQMNHPKDIGAIRDWIADHLPAAEVDAMLATLPTLPIGNAWIWHPEREAFLRFEVRRKRTFDSGRTPKPGERKRAPAILAKVDLDRLGAAMRSAVDEAKANDPKALRARIAELERDAEKHKASLLQAEASSAPRSAMIEIEEESGRLRRELAEARDWEKAMDAVIESASGLFDDIANRSIAARNAIVDQLEAAVKPTRGATLRPAPHERAAAATPPATAFGQVLDAMAKMTPAARWQPSRAVPADQSRRPATSRRDGSPRVEPRQQRVLDSLAWWASIGIGRPNIVATAVMAGYSSNSSSFEKIKGALRAAGLVDYPEPGAMSLTPEGAAIAAVDAPGSLSALHDAILARLEPRQARVMRVLIASRQHERAIADVAAEAGYSPESSSFEKIKGALRSYGFAVYPRPGLIAASDVVFPAGLR